ncbi:mucosal pentraxin-like [Narcine bancroftii]|uniref:mucosal pentraxin-like n=1 Tax=Narcine bancroftii TaxID=1343680 RepID=UPI0038311F6D
MKIFLLLLTLFTTCSAGASRGLLLKSLLFPEDSDSGYVVVQPKQPMRLRAFTLCAKILTDSQQTMSIFSYATSAHHNQILLEVANGWLRLHLAGTRVDFRAPMSSVGWTPICVTWDGQTGLSEAWVHGKRTVAKNSNERREVVAEGVVILGQDQDSVGGGFNRKQRYVGELTDLNLWDSVLCKSEMPVSSRRERGNVIGWADINYGIKGNVTIINPDE